MSTRGSIKIGSIKYYISSDAYPSFAKPVIQKTLRKRPTSNKEFISIANKIVGKITGIRHPSWISGLAPREFGWPHEEYTYTINLKQRTFSGKAILKPRNYNILDRLW